jgi:hypothetical protein
VHAKAANFLKYIAGLRYNTRKPCVEDQKLDFIRCEKPGLFLFKKNILYILHFTIQSITSDHYVFCEISHK